MGKPRAIGEILAEMSHLDRAQSAEILKELDLALTKCQACGSARYGPMEAVGAPQPACRVCGAQMEHVATPVPDTSRVMAALRGRSSAAPSPDGDDWAGQDVPPFQILEKLGSGGMGTVYRAQHTGLGRRVALKVLSADTADAAERVVRRFLREGRSAAALQHPNIVRVYHVGKLRERHFIEMEFIDGPSLRQVVKAQGRLGVAEAVAVAAGTLSGLAYAHERGLVHRDIKPDNIMLTLRGSVRVADFGAAKDLFETSVITRPGLVMGTPWYMSPEQCRGEPLDGRCDLYALGLTLFELLSGERAFHGPDAFAVMRLQQAGPLPDLRRQCPEAPAKLVRFIRKLTAKSPGKRYPSAAAALLELEKIQRGRGIGQADLKAVVRRVRPDAAEDEDAGAETTAPARALNRPFRSMSLHGAWWLLLAAVAAALLAVGVGYAALRDKPPQPRAVHDVEAPE